MAQSNAERQAAWKQRLKDELVSLRQRVSELEAENLALKHQVGELGSALAQSRGAVANERNRARGSRRALGQHLWPTTRR